MDLAMMASAEKLANEFGHLPDSTVIRVLTDCAEEHPDNDAAFVEQAARARLRVLTGNEGQQHE